MENRKLTIFNKIYLIMLCLNIVLLNIFVGSTHQEPKLILETVIMAETLIYIAIAKILKQKQILIKGKVDIAVTLFVISTSLPLMLKTYASLSETVKMCFHYLTVYCMYILARNVVITKKDKNIFINTTLISSIIIVIFGIDKLYFNVCAPFLDYINSAKSDAYGMVSTIGYSNAVFAYFAFLILVCLGMYFENENKKISVKSIYVLYIQIAMYAFFYGNSRAGMIFFSLFFMLYLVKLKNLGKMLQSVFILIITYVLVVVFDRFKDIYTNVFYVCIALIVSLIVSYTANIFYNIFINRISKKNNIHIKNKKNALLVSFVGISLVLLIGVIYILWAKNYSKPTQITGEKRVTLWANNVIKANNTFTIRINYMSYINNEPIEIAITEQDKRRAANKIGEIVINESVVNENKETQVTISDIDLDRVCLRFNIADGNSFTLNKVFINGKEYITNYKYVPNDIMRMIKTINFNNTCVAERFTMYGDGLKLVPKHTIIGNGGRAYVTLYKNVRSYNYTTVEQHNIWLDQLVDYGLIGFTAFCFIIVIAICNYKNRKDKHSILELSIFIAFLFFITHMAFDFDLVYLVTACNFFMYIAVISKEDKNTKLKHIGIADWLVGVVLTGVIVFNCFGIYGNHLYKQGDYAEAIKYLPYSQKIKYEYIKKEKDNLVELQNCIIDYLDKEKNSKQIAVLEKLFLNSNYLYQRGDKKAAVTGYKKIYEVITTNEYKWKYYIYDIYNRTRFYKLYIDKVDKLNKYYDMYGLENKAIKQKIKNEHEENIEEIKNRKLNRQSEDYVNNILEMYMDLYEKILKT